MRTLDINKARQGMDYRQPHNVYIKGRKTPIYSNYVTADDIRKIGNIKEGRSIMIETPNGMDMMINNKKYHVPENSRFKDGPGIRKGAEYSESDITYGKYRREDWKNLVIQQQINDIENKFTHEDILVDNQENPRFVLIPNFKLPKETQKLNPGIKSVPILLDLPDQYPFIPPVGFYMPEEINAGSHSGFSRGYHGASTSTVFNNIRFRWYCSTVVAETWQPARFQYVEDWIKGDNLWHILTMITEVLSDFTDD